MLVGELKCVFVRGNVTLRQIKGVAMGKPSSPPLAIGLCAKREAVFTDLHTHTTN